MQKIFLKQKLRLILLGIFSCLVVLEIGLRLSGFIILSLREYRNRLSLKQKGAYRIVCLGGSTTAEGGEYSYPYQLEEILNKRNIGIKFKVINEGVESADSTFILSNLELNLNKYNPDMVITMMGENDGGNTMLFDDTSALKIKLFFREFKVLKLARLIRLHIVNKAEELGILNKGRKMTILRGDSEAFGSDNEIGQEEKKDIETSNFEEKTKDVEKLVYMYMIKKNQKDFETAEKAINKAIEISPFDAQLYVELADGYVCQGKFKEAEKVLKKAVEIDQNNYRAYDIMAFSYWVQEKYNEAEEALNQAIEINPQDYRAYSDLFYCYEKRGKSHEIQKLCEKLIELDFKDDVFYGFVATYYSKQGRQRESNEYYEKGNNFRFKYYNMVTRHNYQRLKEIMTQKGIKLVCVQHPTRNLRPLKKLFDSTKGIIFVDNEETFKRALRYGKYEAYFRDNFAGDFGHATPKGNLLLAENVANVILKEVFNR